MSPPAAHGHDRASPLVVWGAAGGVIGGVGFAAGHVLSWLGTAPDALAVTGAWLNLGASVALIFAVVGIHEPLRAEAGGLAGAGAVLATVGFALLSGFFTLRVALAYGHLTAEVTEAAELVGLSAVTNGVLLAGLALLGVVALSSRAVGRLTGVGLLVAVAAFAVGFAVPLGGVVGGVLLGAVAVRIAWRLWHHHRGGEVAATG